MSVDPRKAREAALWVLFGLDVGQNWDIPNWEHWYLTAHDVDPAIETSWEGVEKRVEGVLEHREELDRMIQDVSPRWRLERMATIDRNLLRLGAWEIFHSDIPPVVTINECVELGKTYGEESTPAFLNGLLDQLCQDHGVELESS